MKISKLAQAINEFHKLIILGQYTKPKRYWGNSAAGLLFICPEDNTVLLLLRSSVVMQGGTWGVYGGKVEKGEDARQAAFREAEEEIEQYFNNLKLKFKNPKQIQYLEKAREIWMEELEN